VQAMDLVGRKLGRKGGAAPMALFGLISGWISENKDNEKLGFVTKPMQRGLDTLQQATLWLAQHGMANPNDAGAGAVDYLRMMGIVVTGWMWARMAKIAQEKLAGGTDNKKFYEDKLISARYWMERLIPECPMLFERIQAGSEAIMAYDPEMI
jgi:acyl-CoA dehydrogenase